LKFKFSDFKKLLKKTVKIRPTQNSKLAKDRKKKDDVVNIKSSFMIPVIIVIV
jgi:hypothetical protein